MRTRIKFCGLTRAEDIDHAVTLGVDALGFVLWPHSKRAISLQALKELASNVPAFVTRVGLFVDQPREEIEPALAHLDLLQFHGDETPAFCAQFGKPWIKALRMREGVDLAAAAEAYAGAQALLLDAYRPGVPGGTGEVFDWSRIPASLAKPVILAGGLNPSNAAGAVAAVAPYALDVSGGIEASPGVKSRQAMSEFARQVALADRGAE
ncbi:MULTISPECIES: phosphoribosylanthranilate isomerase [unclassified Halomonas]|uniref:phosphoribosylanthranilate isomerase n=1 Tax=unclassified Halomonas TaxID=2609666 RepID=UPI00209D1AA9|nr:MULTISPECIES: phosphoribosylanthranilate isomerase [unclassified Halomonas]MCP1315412.1 phosphoribosylanthranilate isomerase [Halomonas sp. 707D7]MCP1327014.1 phosphoribosylanthranilate isomerase [Halomonas sp. 707D4]